MKSTSDPTDLRASLSLALGAAYIIDRELDAVGTARIFVAHEESLDRDVSIVVLDKALTDGISVVQFASEMHRATLLDEPHTVPVLTVGRTASGQHFYTMPFVRGLSLRQRIEQGPVGFDESIAVLRDVARAMAYAHAQGFVHRHLIPENVLLVRTGAAVADFGLARALDRAGRHATDALLTHSSFTALPYIAPEQAAGDPATDHRADIHAWGVMAYELLLDADPFADVTTSAPQDAVPVNDVSPLQLFKRHGVPEQIALLVMRCCEYDPAARPDSAAEIVEVLERIPDRASTLALERKNAARWIGASIVAALVLLVASGMAVWRLQKRESRVAPLLAVLPFDITGSPADSLLGRRLGDATAAKLSRIAGVRVIDGESVRSMMDSTRSARAIGKGLGADYVLRTSMTWIEDAGGAVRLRVSPLILRVDDGTTRWAKKAQVMSPADPFSMLTTLTTHAANELDVFLGEDQAKVLAAHATRDTAAFSAFAEGSARYRRNVAHAVPAFEGALREYERAYRIDPRYGDALGGAALSLVRLSGAGGHPTLLDSALGLARRALALTAGQAQARNAGAIVAMVQGRLDDAGSWLDWAIVTNPSNVEALELRAELLPQVGDSVGALRDVDHLVALAPRSTNALVVAASTTQTLRRFTEAGELLQRARMLEPARIDLILRVARLGRASGDFHRMARAVREFRRRGGQLSAADLTLLRVGDDGMRRELAESSPASFGIVTRADSATYYSQKAQLALGRRQGSVAQPLLDSSAALLRLLVADMRNPPVDRRRHADLLAWTDAARGDRVRALAVATGVERDTVTLQWPRGQLAAGIACNSAEIYAFADDVEQMITQLRRCLTLPGGYAPNAISAEPALWRHAIDPRLRALLAEFKLEIRRKE